MITQYFEPQDFAAPEKFYPNFVNTIHTAYDQSFRARAAVRICFNDASMILNAADFTCRKSDGSDLALQSAKEFQNLADIRSELGLRTPEHWLMPERVYEPMPFRGRHVLGGAIQRATETWKLVTLQLGPQVLVVSYNDRKDELERALGRCLSQTSPRNKGWKRLSRAIRPEREAMMDVFDWSPILSDIGRRYRY